MKRFYVISTLTFALMGLTTCGGSGGNSSVQATPTVTANTGNTTIGNTNNTGNSNNTTIHNPPPVTKGFNVMYYPIWHEDTTMGLKTKLLGLSVNGTPASSTIDLKKIGADVD